MPKIRVESVRDIHKNLIKSVDLLNKSKSETNFLKYISKYSPVHAIVIKKKNIAKDLLISKSFFLYLSNFSKLEHINLLWRLIDNNEFGYSYLSTLKKTITTNDIYFLIKILTFFNYMGWHKYGMEIIKIHFFKNKNYEYLLSKKFQNKIQENHLDNLLSICASFFNRDKLFNISEKITLHRIREKEAQFGKSHINTIKTNINLANIYRGNSDLDKKKLIKAKVIYENNLKILKKLYSYKNFYLIKFLFDYASILRRLKQNEKAKKITYFLIKKVEQNFGHNHKIILDFKLHLAKIFGKEDIKKSVQILKEIIPKQEKVFGLLSDDVFDSKNSLALRYRDLKNISSSSKLFIDLENIASKKYGAQHVRTLRIARHLATNHKLEGNYLKAEKIYKRMLKVYEKKFDSMDLNLQEPLMELSIIYKKMKNNIMSKKMAERYYAIEKHQRD